MNFWNKLKKPFLFWLRWQMLLTRLFVTHACKVWQARCDLDEFVSADGLASKEGREGLKYDLFYSEKERPIIVQLFSSNPEKMH